MKRFIKLSSIIVTISMLLCLNGCGKSEPDESEYKVAISEHMHSEHGVSIESYKNFSFSESGGASADVSVLAELDGGGSMGMSAQLTVDEDCNISSCSWCDLGIE